MAITKEEVMAELKAAHQQLNDATRRVLALTMKVQNMPSFAFGTQQDDALAGAINGMANGTSSEGSAAAKAAVSIPQMNTQEAIDKARAEVAVHPIVQQALANAKDAVVDAFSKAGMPSHLIEMAKQVSIEHIERHKQSAAQQDPSASVAEFAARTAANLPAAGQASLPDPELKFSEKPNVHEQNIVQHQMLLADFIGAKSVFTQYLSKNAIFGGTGLLEPKFGDLLKYAEDARWTEEAILRDYPNGFYTSRETRATQLLVNTDQMAIVVDGLPSESAPVYVLLYGQNETFKPVQDYSAQELELINAKLHMALQAIVKKNLSQQ